LKNIPHNRPTIGPEEINAVINALSNLELTMGTKVMEFENIFSKSLGVGAVATSSGTSSIHLALIAAGVGRGDEVIIPSYTCVSVAYPILYQDARPVVVDVNPDFNLNVEDLKESIDDRTKAVIVPHMFGFPADIGEIKEICNDEGVTLIEDCSQSIGALYDGKKVGTFGDISIFSFYATKMITSVQGGMLCTDQDELIQKVKDLRYHDQDCSLDDMRLKYSYMMSDISAAVGIEQLKQLDTFIKRRKKIASIYRDEISNVEYPPENSHKEHVYSRYVIKTDHKNEILKELGKNNIGCATMHWPPIYKMKLFCDDQERFQNTDTMVKSSISLPIYPSLKDDEALYIADMFNKIRSRYD